MPSPQDHTRHPRLEPNVRPAFATAFLLMAYLAIATAPVIAQRGERCAWSPDGQHLLYLTETNRNWFVACFDVATGKSHRVFTSPRRDQLRGVTWSPQGNEFATISLNTTRPTSVTAHLLPFPRRGQPQTFTELHGNGYKGYGTLLHTGEVLWLDATGIVQVRREDGAMRRVLHAKGETVSPIAMVGTNVGYVAVKKGTAPLQWELGTIDPTTLVRTPLYDHNTFPGLDIAPNPAFSPKFGRIAVTGYNRATEEHAVLVLDGGEIISTLPLGHASAVHPTDLAWSSDGATVFAYLRRRPKALPVQRRLFESAFSGSASRETELFTGSDTSVVRRPYGLSISPDGKTAAIVSQYTFMSEPVLFVVDLSDKARPVTRIESPHGIEIVLHGSDMLLATANAWQSAWGASDSERRMLVRGGGSAAGLAALTAGTAHLALTSREVSPTEHALAKGAGLKLNVRCIVREVIAVCVHPDNPLPSIHAMQLQRLFTDKNDKQWSNFGVTIREISDPEISDPKTSDSKTNDQVTTAMLLPGSPQYTPFRKAVLNNRSPAGGHTIFDEPSALGEFVRTHRNAIACLPVETALRLGDAIRIVPITNKTIAVAPTAVAIKDSSYPLTDSWYVVSHQHSGPRVRAFLEWLGSDEAHRATATVGRRPAK